MNKITRDDTEHGVEYVRADGAELKPFTGRPGSMDAYGLPSLRNGVRTTYSGPKPILTGQLVDKQNHTN
jgi:hypothetical protein